MGVNQQDLTSCQDMLDFIEASPSPFHAVAEAGDRLSAAGFAELMEGDAWRLEPQGRYFVKRNDSSIVAFVIGEGALRENGFRILGAHTDSPNLRLKPRGTWTSHG